MTKILIIDDESIGEVLQMMLRSKGFDARLATDGDEGTKAFASDPAELVVCDVNMPNKEGLQTIMELRKASSAVKIIVMSGMLSDRETFLGIARKLGADAAVPKPFRVADMLLTINALLAAGPRV